MSFIFTVMNNNDAFYNLVNKLQPLYDTKEATAIAHEVMEHITGLGKLQRLMDKDMSFSSEQLAIYEQMLPELMQGRPMQYVLGYAWFMGRKFKVNEQVLIPRPETEELVQWVIKSQIINDKSQILDIGTGSGCIPISLKLALPDAEVTSCDISNEAIAVATENALILDASVEFIHCDFLDNAARERLGKYDVIVSNPPYIPITEKESLHTNVREYEPAMALFVDDDALLFYKAIAAFGKMHLNNDGAIYCELHRDYAVATKMLFEQQGYTTELLKDMHSNDRMLKAIPTK